jgi:hypothetical protein
MRFGMSTREDEQKKLAARLAHIRSLLSDLDRETENTDEHAALFRKIKRELDAATRIVKRP